MLDRTLAPDFRPITKISIPQIQSYTLPNGVPLYVVNVGEQPVIRLEVIFEAGTWYETQEGTSYFTTKMLNEGTSEHTSAEISAYFDQYGAFTEFFHNAERAGITVFGLSKHLPKLLPMVHEILHESIFPEKELEGLRRISLQNLKVNLEKTAYVATQTFRKQIFGAEHPYGRHISEEAIKSVNQSDLTAFNQQFFKGKNYKIFLSGRVSEQEINLIKQYLGNETLYEQTNSFDYELSETNAITTFIAKPNNLQSSIRMGKRLFNRSHPDYFKMLVTNEILGGYFGSRLMRNIREEKGFTYGISSSLVSYTRAGYFVIGTDVKKENTTQTIDEIYKEIKTLQTELVSETELDTVKNFMCGEFAGSVNTPFEIADRHKIMTLDGIPNNFYDYYVPKIRAVTAEEIIEMANQYLKIDSLNEIVVGGK